MFSGTIFPGPDGNQRKPSRSPTRDGARLTVPAENQGLAIGLLPVADSPNLRTGCDHRRKPKPGSGFRASRGDLSRLQVLHHDRDRLAENLCGAELDDLRPRVVNRRVTRRDVVRVARLVGLLTIGEPEAHPPLDHVAPAGKLGAVVGQAVEQPCEIGVRRVRLEADGMPAVEVLEANVEPSNAICSDAVSLDTLGILRLLGRG